MSLLIYTVASGAYERYAPLFNYCAERAYPECKVLVDIIDEPRMPYEAACWRYLSSPEHEGPVYITDIDMMIFRESPTIQEYHEREMTQTGLCYSNSPRGTGEAYGALRMTGLHYVLPEWFAKTEEIRLKKIKMIEDGKLGNNQCDDELMLMEICKSLGPIPESKPLLERHHGIHLGTIRATKKYRSHHAIEMELLPRVSVQRAAQWLEMIKEPEWQRISADVPSEIRFELDTLTKYCRRREAGQIE